jgi:hypothetical protein
MDELAIGEHAWQPPSAFEEALGDVIHLFPAFNRVLGESLQDLAATLALQSA